MIVHSIDGWKSYSHKAVKAFTPTEILDGIQVGDYNKMDYGNSNVAGKMRRSDGRTDDKEYDGIWQM